MWSTSVAIVVILSASIAPSWGKRFDPSSCSRNNLFLTQYKPQIHDSSYRRDLTRLRDQIRDNERGSTYEAIASFVDTYGSRFVSSRSLQDAILEMAQSLETDFPGNVQLDPLVVLNWARGREWAEISEPDEAALNMLSYMGSVGTDGQIWAARILLVHSAKELRQRRNQARDSFVVLNFPFNWTGDPVADTYGGFSEAYNYATDQIEKTNFLACQFGAKAFFTRSLVYESYAVPHTDYVEERDPNCRIPIVALATEDTDRLERMVRRGQAPRLRFYSESKPSAKPAISKNIVGKFPGIAEGDPEALLITGQSDSVDIGQGALDNAAGTFVFTQGLQTIASMVRDKKIRPPLKRIKFAVTTSSEVGNRGLIDYIHRHGSYFDRVALAFESDQGIFQPEGISLNTNTDGDTLPCILTEIMKVCAHNITRIEIHDQDQLLQNCGLPVTSPISDNQYYLDYRNSAADTMTALSSDDLDQTRALMTCIYYGMSRLRGTLIFGDRTANKKCPIQPYTNKPVVIPQQVGPTYGYNDIYVNGNQFGYYRHISKKDAKQ